MKYSGRKIQKLTRQKGILLNGRTVFLQKQVKTGDVLRVLAFEDSTYGVEPEPGPVEILYEDSYLIILNKLCGLLVHPAGQTSRGTLGNYLAHYYQQHGAICTIRSLHRLDRETSGCVVFAKDGRTQALLEKFLQEGSLKRTYRDLAHIGHPIIGDRMYGKGSALISGQALHAFSLRFPHPVEQREIAVEAPFPLNFLQVLQKYSR